MQQAEEYPYKPTLEHKNINFYIERDSALRAHEIMVVSLGRDGKEKEWFSFYVTDQGSIRTVQPVQQIPRTEERDG